MSAQAFTQPVQSYRNYGVWSIGVQVHPERLLILRMHTWVNYLGMIRSILHQTEIPLANEDSLGKIEFHFNGHDGVIGQCTCALIGSLSLVPES